ncbi:MAG: serine hydrolase [Planctomycetaceae bacterium]|jgi:CubicO group peptidase (beta-lactamase class C family)|nr:serine hydrolase [Planctomycetaceae bacterium]
MHLRCATPLALIAAAALTWAAPPSLRAEPASTTPIPLPTTSTVFVDPLKPARYLDPRTPDERTAGFNAAADYSAERGGRALLVMQGGKVIFQRYDNTWSASRPHPLASGTKSFVGVLAVAAISDGLLTGFDERAADTLTEWQTDPRKSKITVRNLLQLNSGLEAADALLGGRGGSSVLGEGASRRNQRLDRERTGPAPRDLGLAALEVDAINEPGSVFRYGPSHFYAFGELLKRKIAARKAADPAFPYTGVEDYLIKRILTPAGVSVFRIGKDPSGNPNLPGGSMLTAENWARFGRFVTLGGAVISDTGEPTQVLDPKLLAECFKPSPTNKQYGLTWWLGSGGEPELTVAESGLTPADSPAATPADGKDEQRQTLRDRLRERYREQLRERNQQGQTRAPTLPDGQTLELFMAAGLGKQRLYLLPQLDLVIVRFGEATRNSNQWDNAAFLSPIVGIETLTLAPADAPPGKPAQSGQ